jgi:hypothetical protein
MAETNRARHLEITPLRIGLDQALRSDFARELYTSCFFHPEWLRNHAPITSPDPSCLSCGGADGFELPDAPFCFGIHIVLNNEQWYSAVLCAPCHAKLVAELERTDEF